MYIILFHLLLVVHHLPVVQLRLLVVHLLLVGRLLLLPVVQLLLLEVHLPLVGQLLLLVGRHLPPEVHHLLVVLPQHLLVLLLLPI